MPYNTKVAHPGRAHKHLDMAQNRGVMKNVKAKILMC